MKHHSLLYSLAGGALLLATVTPALAQPGRGDPPNGMRRGPGFGPERGPRAKGELNRVWHDIADLEGSKFALNKAQAAKVVALVLPVSKQKTLSDANAKTLGDKIEAVLTAAQKSQIARDHPRGRRGDGEGHPDGPPPRDGNDGPPRDREGNGPRGDGPPRMNREDFEKVRPFMDALNPFYPPTGYAKFKSLPADFAKEMAKRYGERRTLLETLSKRAKGK